MTAPTRVLSSVDRSDGTGLRIAIDPPRLTARQRARCDQAIADALADIAAWCPEPEAALGAAATERLVDLRAYRAEAARRGVLPW